MKGMEQIIADLRAAGHWVPDKPNAIAVLIMREMAKRWVGDPNGGNRKAFGEWLVEIRGTGPTGDLYGLAEAAVEALPAEVWIGKGGCGGEPIVAGFTEDTANELIRGVLEYFNQSDRHWPGIERVPLLKR